MNEFNPYEPPRDAATISIPDPTPRRPTRKFSYVAWLFVFAINMAVPLYFSHPVTEYHGRLGLLFGALLLLALGYYICAVNRRFSSALIVGGAIIAITQVFPVIQIIAGMLGMTVGKAMGLASLGDDHGVPQITTEEGGFIVTLVTGGILMAAAACSGMLLRLVTPAHWWPSSNGPARP